MKNGVENIQTTGYNGARMKVHLLFQELLGIGCLKSLLMLALLKRFPYTVL